MACPDPADGQPPPLVFGKLNDMINILDKQALRESVTGLSGDLSIVLVAVIWGSTYVLMQDVGHDVPTAAFLMLRFLCALPALAIPAFRTIRLVTPDELRTGVFFGSLLFGILILETVGVKHTSAANAGFLITTSVVLIPVLERLISKRRQLRVVYLMTLTGLLGCGLLLQSRGTGPRPGDFIILSAALIRATQITLFGRRSDGAKQSLVNLSLIEFVTVAVLAGGTSLIAGEHPWRVATTVSATDWLLIAYLGILGTSFAFFAQLRAARAASSTRVGLILSTEPMFSTIFAVTWANDTLGVSQVLGGLLLIVSAAVGRTFEGRPPSAAEIARQPTPMAVAGPEVGPEVGPVPQPAPATQV